MDPAVHAIYAYVIQACRGGLIVDLLSPSPDSSAAARSTPELDASDMRCPTFVTVSPDRRLGPSLCAQASALPLASGVAGAVLLGEELWLNAAPHAVIEEAKRVMTSEGVLAMLVPAGRTTGSATREESSWWEPSSGEVGSLLRRHFPHVSTLDAVPTDGCALWSPRGEPRAERVLAVTSRERSGREATHVLFVASRRRRKLPGGPGPRAQGVSTALEHARRDLADALRAGGAAREAVAEQTRRLGELEAEGRRLSASLIAERRRARDAEERCGALEREVAALEEALRSERERAAADTAELARATPLLAREAGRATQAEAARERLEQALARERDRREVADAERARSAEALAAMESIADQAEARAAQLEREIALEASRSRKAELMLVDLTESLARARSDAAAAGGVLNEALRRADDLAEEAAALQLELARSRSGAS